MNDIPVTPLLQQLMDYGKALPGDANGYITIDRFILAILDAVDKKIPVCSPGSLNNLMLQLKEKGYDLPLLKHMLQKHIQEDESSSTDVMQMRLVMQHVWDDAQGEGKKALSSESLLKNLLYLRPGTLSSAPKETETKTKTETTIETKTDSVKTQAKGTTVPSQAEIEKITVRVKEVGKQLSDIVKGQDKAISVLMNGYFQSEFAKLAGVKPKGPAASFLFAGPPGVGKTLMAESVADILDRPFQRYDMSGYSDKEAALEFCGSDKVYKNGSKGNFTKFVEEHPNAVVLFDEIEKAHLNIIYLFLQMLDKGTIRDGFTDENLPLHDVIMIFTTNAGKQLYENSETTILSGLSRKVILDALEKDVNPLTNEPFFPGAICSRFASGNVVMFNHIPSHIKADIAINILNKKANEISKVLGCDVSIDPNICSAVLFAEGGKGDARMITSRSNAFFTQELFELFRLMDQQHVKFPLQKIKKLNFEIQLPEDDEVRDFFEPVKPLEGLVLTSKAVALELASFKCKTVFHCTDDIEEAKEILKKKNISFLLLDYSMDVKNTEKYLNTEDVDTKSKLLLDHIQDSFSEFPIFLLETKDMTLSDEERVSFSGQGILKGINLADSKALVLEQIEALTKKINQQLAVDKLAKSNKVIEYQTAQIADSFSKTATIRLIDFKLVQAIDSEDTGNILGQFSTPDVTFNEIVGAEDAKKELETFISYLKNPKQFIGTGIKAPKGVLLYGPPGTGKTMLAKALASESGVTFIATEGNQFVKPQLGSGAEKVHEVFRTARKYAPCIIFVDEIDVIAKNRQYGESNDEVLTAFLTEMDGFKANNARPVFVLAATNFQVSNDGPQALDPAILRRFDRRILVDLPNKAERMKYMQILIGKNQMFQISDEMLTNLSIRSTGMSPAAIESVFELALRSCFRKQTQKVTDDIIEEAFESFHYGDEVKWDEKELTKTAYHEAGHALICWLSGLKPSYLTIVARGNHGGYMQHGDRENKGSYTKEELFSLIRTSLAGRAAEMVVYGNKDGITTGASSDLRNATGIATDMITYYGMDEDFGLAVIDLDSKFAESVAQEIRSKVNSMLQTQLELVIEILQKQRVALDALTKLLLEKNQLTGTEIDEVLSKHIISE